MAYHKPGAIANFLSLHPRVCIRYGDHFGQLDNSLKDFDLAGPLSEILI